MKDEAHEIADKARGIAAEKRLTHDRIANALGLSRGAVSARMNGNISFTGAELLRLSRLVSVDIDKFFPAESAERVSA